MATPETEDTQALHTLSEAFIRLYNAGEIDGLVATCYTEDAHLLPPSHPAVRGAPQLREFFHSLRAAGVGVLAAETTQMEVSGDIAYCLGNLAFGTLDTHRGAFLEVYPRQADGSWKMVADMFNRTQASS